MALLVSDVIDLACSAYLNDPGQTNYKYSNMSAIVKAAMLALESELFANGISTLEETSAVLAIPASRLELSSSTNPALPTDLILPVRMDERPDGTLVWTRMHERETLPIRDMGTTLIDWTWEKEGIQFIGATLPNDVRLFYLKSLSAIVDQTSPIYVLGALSFLAAKSAALAALTIGNNPERAQALEGIAQHELDAFIRARVKETQSYPARRLPYAHYRRQFRRRQLQGR